jgi:hypothetical protein
MSEWLRAYGFKDFPAMALGLLPEALRERILKNGFEVHSVSGNPGLFITDKSPHALSNGYKMLSKGFF